MGNLEARVVDPEILVEKNVKVNVPGPLVDDLPATQEPLNVLQGVEKGERLERGRDLPGRSVGYGKTRQTVTNLTDSIDESILV